MTAQIPPSSPAPQWKIERSDERGLKDARRILGDVLGVLGISDPDLVHLAKTIMSELVANALEHTRTACVPVRVLVEEDGRPVIEVEDESDARPTLRPIVEVEDGVLPEHFDSGRGLAMVEIMAAYWGYSFLARGGKVVWAALPIVLDATATRASPSVTSVPRVISGRRW
ncbi:ATP-binding protein [Actinomadura gamaensis]|uniref:ATP-binding protein n=1 Tax=Actinomadura gamaensis TaxID=1763541 RepID=A0ABV9TVK3_9ACTN